MKTEGALVLLFWRYFNTVKGVKTVKNRHILSFLVSILIVANDLDPFYSETPVNIEADNMSADSAEASYHVAQAVSNTLFEALLVVIGGGNGADVVRTMDVEVNAKVGTHKAKLTRTVFPTETVTATNPKPAVVDRYSPEIAQYVHNFVDDARADVADMLKAFAAAHFEDTDGGEGSHYAIARRSTTEEP